MADSATNLDVISSSQASKEVTSNALSDAASPSMLFGRRASTTSALSWGHYGGKMRVDGVLTAIANGVVALTASQTNYVEATRAGVVSANIVGYTAGRIPLYTIVAGASTVTSYTDHRLLTTATPGLLSLALSDANTTLTAAQASNAVLEFTGSLTAQRDIVLPLAPQLWTVKNGTTGGFGLRFIGASGTGFTVPAGQSAVVYANATNVASAIRDPGYTVATLPVGSVGARSYATDALTPVFGAVVAGGGAVVIPVFHSGTAWIVG